LGWYRRLVAQKYDGSKNCKNLGRPRISEEIVEPGEPSALALLLLWPLFLWRQFIESFSFAITADIPSEAELTPKLWGKWRMVADGIDR
jgi:hypothetical protein